jgi:hypothetical protein
MSYLGYKKLFSLNLFKKYNNENSKNPTKSVKIQKIRWNPKNLLKSQKSFKIQKINENHVESTRIK